MTEEKITEINEKTTVEDLSVTQITVADEVAPPKKCAQCGAELTEEQIFCPHCGQKNDLLISGEISEAIAQFNQGIVEQSKKKKKRIKLLIVLLIIFGVIAASAAGVYFYFNSQVEGIINEISSSNPSSATIEADYKALTPVGQFLFRGKIINAFVDEVSDNAYSDSSSQLVNQSTLDKYSVYQKIGNTLNITSDDGTNVMSHIDAVLKLESYTKYNGIYKCILNSMDNYTDCLDNIESALNYSSYYLMELYIGYAYSDAQDALSAAKKHSSGDSLCKKYVNALDTIENELGELYYDYGYFSSSSVTAAMDTIFDIVDEVSDVEDSVGKIVNSIPSIN